MTKTKVYVRTAAAHSGCSGAGVPTEKADGVSDSTRGGMTMSPASETADTFESVRTTDLLVLAGGGIHGHPDGVAAGVESMRTAWDAAASGEDLASVLARSSPVRRAVEAFGGIRA